MDKATAPKTNGTAAKTNGTAKTKKSWMGK